MLGRPHALIVYTKTTDGRSVVTSAWRNASQQITEVMAAKVTDDVRNRDVVEVGEHIEDLAPTVTVPRQNPANIRGRRPQAGLVLLVPHRVETLAQRLAALTCEKAAHPFPYLTVIVSQPAAWNIAPIRPAAMSGTTRSSDWRLRSTTHITLPRRGVIGSTSASQMAPSSSSASPTSAMLRPQPATLK